MAFPIIKATWSVETIYQREPGYLQAYEDYSVQPKLDKHCIFGLGLQQSEKAINVTKASVELAFCSILPVEKFFNNM